MDRNRRRNRWDQAPTDKSAIEAQEEVVESQPAAESGRKRSRWDQPPVNDGLGGGKEAVDEVLVPLKKRSRWDRKPEIDVKDDSDNNATVESNGLINLRQSNSLEEEQKDIQDVNKGFSMQDDMEISTYDVPPEIPGVGGLQFFKSEDMMHFSKLMGNKDESELTKEEKLERKILKLLLKIKNGTPAIRKAAMRHITDRAKQFGPGPLFNQVLPLLMSPSLEDQERHLLVKVIDRILSKLGSEVRPFVHKILIVIEPLLIDENKYTRNEGREIISNLSKAAGLTAMISTMKNDINHKDEHVRNTTARAFAVIASALGISNLIPFLTAVCNTKKSWEARHTGILIVQQIAILLGVGILPHLTTLVSIISKGLTDEILRIRSLTAVTLSHLAEVSKPYGIESFQDVLETLWGGVKKYSGKSLASFLRAVGSIIPLMEDENADNYTREVIQILIREFQTTDDDMRRTVLQVIKNCSQTNGISSTFLKTEVLPDFFKYFWTRRLAIDKRTSKLVIDTTTNLSKKTGASVILTYISNILKDENEAFRNMASDAISECIKELGTTDIDNRLELNLIDGFLFAFHEQSQNSDSTILDGLGIVVNAFNERMQPYLEQLISTILWRINHKDPGIRQQAIDLISQIAQVIFDCNEQKLLNQLGTVLYENLGEEYPECLGSILKSLKSIVTIIGAEEMTPPIGELLPRLTPILRNHYEKVQENCIDLVGTIADKGPEFVSSKEWMRICFELVDLLKAHRKGIRRASVSTFGYISKAIGPHDVLATLLNNLKVQERQNRVCTTVAIAIVAESCAPFTVLPALMNEYRVLELNVQNGVLKSLAFLFEYIGEMGKDYVYAIAPLFEDALMDRDIVHRQTACTAIKNMALGVVGLGCEDVLVHLLNFIWPNIFETSPHMIKAVLECIEGLRVALGSGTILMYLLSGLFHPARKVREIYWKIYNNLYIRSQDSLVAFYPSLYNKNIIESDSQKDIRGLPLQYVRQELDILI